MRSIEAVAVVIAACFWICRASAQPLEERPRGGRVELAGSGGVAHLSCAESCGDLSLGWAAGARALYRIHGVAIGGVVEPARFAWTPENERESGAIGVTLTGVIGRVYGEGKIVEPYAELGLGFPFIASTVNASGHPGAGLF